MHQAHNKTDSQELLNHPAVQAIQANPEMLVKDAAEQNGTTQPQLSKWLRRLHEEGLIVLPPRLAKRKPREGSLHPLDVYRYPVYTGVSAGPFNGNSHEVEMDGPDGEYTSLVYVPRTPGYPPPFALRVNGHSMTNPQLDVDFPDGTIVLCNPALVPERWDYVVAINVVTNSMTFKQLVMEKTENGERLWLHALNPEYKDELFDHENFQVAGVVVDASLPKYTKKGVITRRR